MISTVRLGTKRNFVASRGELSLKGQPQDCCYIVFFLNYEIKLGDFRPFVSCGPFATSRTFNELIIL
jgi:hypothetical protein